MTLGSELAMELRKRVDAGQFNYAFYQKLARVDSIGSLKDLLNASGFRGLRVSLNAADIADQMSAELQRRRLESCSHAYASIGGLFLLTIGAAMLPSAILIGSIVIAVGASVAIWFAVIRPGLVR